MADITKLGSDELLATNSIYDDCEADWKKYKAFFAGTQAIIDGGYFEQHPRESDENFEKRKAAAITLDLSGSIVRLFRQYLFDTDPTYSESWLDGHALYPEFVRNADKMGSTQKTFWGSVAEQAMVYGHYHVMVDKPVGETQTLAESVERRFHPYYVPISPLAMLDWRYEFVDGAPVLTYAKAVDQSLHYRIWTPDQYAVYRYDPSGLYGPETADAELVRAGENPIGVVPIVTAYSQRDMDNRLIGVSQIKETVRIDLAIMQNISQADEIIDIAGFPMLTREKQPPAPHGQSGNDGHDEILTGPSAVLEYQEGGQPPDWLEAKVEGPVKAIMEWVERKSRYAYQMVHAGTIAGVIDREAKSGVALKREFQQLNAALANKAHAIAEADAQARRLWAMWEGAPPAALPEIDALYPTAFDVEDLMAEIEQLIASKVLVRSDTFHRAQQKRLARKLDPDMTPDTTKAVDAEIDAAPVQFIEAPSVTVAE